MGSWFPLDVEGNGHIVKMLSVKEKLFFLNLLKRKGKKTTSGLSGPHIVDKTPA